MNDPLIIVPFKNVDWKATSDRANIIDKSRSRLISMEVDWPIMCGPNKIEMWHCGEEPQNKTHKYTIL